MLSVQVRVPSQGQAGLESLLTKGDENIQYKVSLNAALILGITYEDRNDVIKKI